VAGTGVDNYGPHQGSLLSSQEFVTGGKFISGLIMEQSKVKQ
jgi:hypothetical protein